MQTAQTSKQIREKARNFLCATTILLNFTLLSLWEVKQFIKCLRNLSQMWYLGSG